MTNINPAEYARAVQILTGAFSNIPGVLSFVKKDEKIAERVEVLCRFCLNISIQKKGAYMTNDKNGVALIYRNSNKVNLLFLISEYMKLGNHCIGWDRAIDMIIRERTIIRKRPTIEHLYFLMMAINNHANGHVSTIEIRDFVFALSKKLQLPILAETTVEKNINLYQRYGFRVYDEWFSDKDQVKVWFLMRDFDR